MTSPVPPVRSRARLVWIVVLAVAVAAALGVLAFSLIQLVETQQRLDEANDRIDEQRQQIEERDQRIEEQNGLLDEKATFRAAMGELLAVAKQFDGVPVGGIVPIDDFDVLASSAWRDRRNPARMADHIEGARTARAALEALGADAAAEAGLNATGTAFEATIDQLGGGFVTSRLDDASAYCGRPALGCVGALAPTVIHFDAGGNAAEYMTDWIRTGVAYHEFAHVLQFTNPGPTEDALTAFGGDHEMMADCFALTFLPGWTLDQTVWVSAEKYYEVRVGYDQACDAGQQQVVRDWYSRLGFHSRPVSQ